MNKKMHLFVLFFSLICSFPSFFIHSSALSIFEEGDEAICALNHQSFLRKKKSSYVFVILAHVRNEEDNKLWTRCYHSVREFYPKTPIIIIDDNSALPITNQGLENTTVIRSKYPCAGELLPYYYFLKNKWADKMIFLHDSMLLRRQFTHQELNVPIKFHWYFDLHCWDDDTLINSLLSHLSYADELIDYNVNHKEAWNGCFGVASIIDLNVLEKVEKKYGLTGALKTVIKIRDQRSALERVFGIIMFKEKYVNKNNCANFGNIVQFPHYYSYINDQTVEELKQTYPGAILKTWQGR